MEKCADEMIFGCKVWEHGTTVDFWIRRTPCLYYLLFLNEEEYHLHVEYWKRDPSLPYGGRWVVLCLPHELEEMIDGPIEVKDWKYSRPKHIPEGVKELLHACGCREYEKDGVWYLDQCPTHKIETDLLIELLKVAVQ